jgi:hypothetical protein
VFSSIKNFGRWTKSRNPVTLWVSYTIVRTLQILPWLSLTFHKNWGLLNCGLLSVYGRSCSVEWVIYLTVYFIKKDSLLFSNLAKSYLILAVRHEENVPASGDYGSIQRIRGKVSVVQGFLLVLRESWHKRSIHVCNQDHLEKVHSRQVSHQIPVSAAASSSVYFVISLAFTWFLSGHSISYLCIYLQ